MKIKSFIFTVLLIIIPLLSISKANSKTAIYYLGDAIIYNGRVVIGSTNMGGGLELLKLEGNKIIKTSQIGWVGSLFSNSNQFYGFTFSEEQGKLYAYLVDGRYLYKYDISNLSAPNLIFKIRDNAWDYFMGVDKQDQVIITIGIKGIKVWNLAGQIINSYNLTDKYAYNVNYQSGNYIITAATDRLKFFDKSSRQFTKEIPFVLGEIHNRKTFVDQANQAVYLVDDESLKKFDYNGEQKNIFKHISNRGYDVAGFADQNHLYFTDGLGIVKFSKDNLKPMKWAYTTDLGVKNGWAMGLKVLRDSSGEKIVIFNNSSILVLNQDLKMISHIAADTIDSQPQENLFLRLSSNQAATGSAVTLSGGGYAAGEDLTITLAGQNYSVKTAANGRFTLNIAVPAVKPMKTDIKVVGALSGLSYSIGFEIQ